MVLAVLEVYSQADFGGRAFDKLGVGLKCCIESNVAWAVLSRMKGRERRLKSTRVLREAPTNSLWNQIPLQFAEVVIDGCALQLRRSPPAAFEVAKSLLRDAQQLGKLFLLETTLDS